VLVGDSEQFQGRLSRMPDPLFPASTVFGLTLMIRANPTWLTLNDLRMARIWLGVNGLGGGGSSVT